MELGRIGRCRIGGYEGVIAARTVSLYRDPQVLIVPERVGQNGERVSGEWFDEKQVDYA